MYRTAAVSLLDFKTSVECRARLWIVANAPVRTFDITLCDKLCESKVQSGSAIQGELYPATG